MSNHFAKRRLQRAEQDRNVSDAARHRSSGVLLVGDRNNSVLRHKTECRFQPTMFSTADGPVIDPSVSVPTATEQRFAAAPLAEPALDPHDV